jgi:predicted nucleotide-binding protein (sugar kinase/HSP70/actin superfamily)
LGIAVKGETMQVQTQKTTYIPYMCDHSYLLQAVYQSFGLPAEVLPPPNDETAKIGMDLVLGRECSPCLLVVGDIVHRLRQPGFDPERSILLMPTALGPCRFGQYNVLMRHILKEQGMGAVEIAAPSAENSYHGFGDRPREFRMQTWKGIVVLDLLQQLLHRHRPYEVNKGETDALYTEGLERTCTALRQGGKSLPETVKWAAKEFATLPVAETEPRPLIGMIGEIYLRFSGYSNREVIRKIEELGGEVVLASMMEWIYYTNWWCSWKGRVQRDYWRVIQTTLSDVYQRYVEHRFTRPVAKLLRHPYEPRIDTMLRHVKPYLDPAISTEAVLTLGKAIELGKGGASGILNVMPFSCMPGIISAGIGPRIRLDLNNIPWLDISYDMQKTTNIQTRLEAFMYQAAHYQRRHNGQPAAVREQAAAAPG